MAPGTAQISRAHVLLEHDRLPGPPTGCPLPARHRRLSGAGPHAERHCSRGWAHDRRANGELPDSRWGSVGPASAAGTRSAIDTPGPARRERPSRLLIRSPAGVVRAPREITEKVSTTRHPLD